MALPGSSSAGAGQAGDVPPLSAAAAASAAVAVHPSGGPPRRASMFACVTTLSNTLLGVSVVGVAGGFARAGCAVRRVDFEFSLLQAFLFCFGSMRLPRVSFVYEQR